ncbi:MAG: hypothetical protein JSV44_09585, partial [Candidatus Zixiibacteriota bacterium]
EAGFRAVVLETMGELRASHLYIYSNAPVPDKSIKTGATGIELDYAVLDRDGVFRVDRVLSDSPADRAGIKAGQYITTIAGAALTRETSIDKLLNGTIDHRLAMGISDKPGGEVTELYLKPISSGKVRSFWYDDWVARRRSLVDSLSGGRLAYIHIPEMSRSKLAIFIEQLVAIAEPKEGLILDIRDNGGGNTAVHILGMLERAPYIMRNFRGFPTISENKMRSKALEKPMILLINQYSASNSEIFAEGFRKLGLGKIVGTSTAGGVIGTSSYRLIDGTRIRRPSWGAYTVEMEDTDLFPREPDIYIENLLDDFINDRDPQLIRAVRELMKELK